MLGKYRLRPSLLLEVGFMLAVWLCAWLVFDAPLTVIIITIFAAYGVVFLYENWLDSVSRRERAAARRSQRRASDLYGSPAEFGGGSPPPPAPTVTRVSRAEPAVRAPAVAEPLASEPQKPERQRDEDVRAGEPFAEPSPPVVAESPARPPEAAAVKAPGPEPSAVPEQMIAPEPEPVPKPQPAPSLSPEPPKLEPAPTLQPRPGPAEMPVPDDEVVKPVPSSRLAEIAAGPDAPKKDRPVGGWNVWQLERLLAAQPRHDQERDYERSLLLVYLRDFADSDGQLPPAFDDLVRESFGDLVRGPATPRPAIP